MSELPKPKDVELALGQLIFANGGSMLPQETVQPLANRFELTDERRYARKTSDNRLTWDNRVHWARLGLANQGLIKKHVRGRWELTDLGMRLFENQKIRNLVTIPNNVIDDLDDDQVGKAVTSRRAYSGTFFVRDNRVRRKVIKRSKGRCEHCGEIGFLKPEGTYYVEAHHIISLAEQGPDTLENVIALCPKHHRQAHFGADSEELEAQFKIKLAKIRGK